MLYDEPIRLYYFRCTSRDLVQIRILVTYNRNAQVRFFVCFIQPFEDVVYRVYTTHWPVIGKVTPFWVMCNLANKINTMDHTQTIYNMCVPVMINVYVEDISPFQLFWVLDLCKGTWRVHISKDRPTIAPCIKFKHYAHKAIPMTHTPDISQPSCRRLPAFQFKHWH